MMPLCARWPVLLGRHAPLSDDVTETPAPNTASKRAIKRPLPGSTPGSGADGASGSGINAAPAKVAGGAAGSPFGSSGFGGKLTGGFGFSFGSLFGGAPTQALPPASRAGGRSSSNAGPSRSGGSPTGAAATMKRSRSRELAALMESGMPHKVGQAVAAANRGSSSAGAADAHERPKGKRPHTDTTLAAPGGGNPGPSSRPAPMKRSGSMDSTQGQLKH